MLHSPTIVQHVGLRILCITAFSLGALSSASLSAACQGIFTINKGTLGGGGQVRGDLTNIGGSLAPGSGIGRFTIQGNYCQLSGGEMVFDIGGTRQGIEHDFLSIKGDAELAGIFRIELVNGFLPADGDAFNLLDVENVHGSFDALDLPDLDGPNSNGLKWDLSSLLNTGVVRVVPEPAWNKSPQGGLSVCLLLLHFLRTSYRRRSVKRPRSATPNRAMALGSGTAAV